MAIFHNSLQLPIHRANPSHLSHVHVYRLNASMSELHYWHKDRLFNIHTVKNCDLKGYAVLMFKLCTFKISPTLKRRHRWVTDGAPVVVTENAIAYLPRNRGSLLCYG